MSTAVPPNISELTASRQRGMSLEQACYTDPTIFSLDMKRLFTRYWLFAGLTIQVPNPGDYFLFEAAGESILIIRDREQHLHALFNICRHWGSRICTQASEQVKALVCPYHASKL
jgi:glycine betaine monooxygenase A